MLELQTRANIHLSNMNYWFIANKLSVNVDKTCYAIFSSKRSTINLELDLFIGNNKLNRVKDFKYLGLLIDDALKWDLHIDHVYSKIIKFTGIFYKIRDCLSTDNL